MNKLLKNTALYTIGNILPQAMSFILLPLYTRHLSTEQYGIVSSMQVVQIMLAIFFSLCLERSIIRLYWDYKTQSEKDRFLGTVSLAIFINSLIVLVIVFLIRNIMQTVFNDISFYPYYVYAILASFFLTFSLVPKNYYRLKNEAGKYVIISILQMMLSIALIIWFMVIKEEGAVGMLKGKMLAFLLLVPVFIYIIRKNINIIIDLKMLKECFSFCLPIIPTSIAAWALTQFDRIFIAKYFTLSDVGIFSLSKRIAGLVGMFSGSFMLAYHPIFFELASSGNQLKAKTKLYKYNNAYILANTLFAFLIAFFSREIVTIFLDDRYHSAYQYIPPIVLAMLVGSVCSTVIGASFQQSKKMKQDMIIGISAAIFTVVVGNFLIGSFGIMGAVWVSIISSIYIFSCGYMYAKKNCYGIFVEWDKAIKNLLALCAILIAFNYFIHVNVYLSLIIKLISSGCIILYYIRKSNIELFKLISLKSKFPKKLVK